MCNKDCGGCCCGESCQCGDNCDCSDEHCAEEASLLSKDKLEPCQANIIEYVTRFRGTPLIDLLKSKHEIMRLANASSKLKYKKLDLGYMLLVDYCYYSKRYNNYIFLETPFHSNGANFVKDLDPRAFFVHDHICIKPFFIDGTPITVLQSAMIYRDILKEDGYGFRADLRFIGTFLMGCQKCRKNGWWKMIKRFVQT